jgi:hypothetical protein
VNPLKGLRSSHSSFLIQSAEYFGFVIDPLSMLSRSLAGWITCPLKPADSLTWFSAQGSGLSTGAGSKSERNHRLDPAAPSDGDAVVFGKRIPFPFSPVLTALFIPLLFIGAGFPYLSQTFVGSS